MKNTSHIITLKWIAGCLAGLLLLHGCTCHSHPGKPSPSADSGAVTGENEAGRDTMTVDTEYEPDHFDTATRQWLSRALDNKQLQGNFTLKGPETETDSTPTQGKGSLGPVTSFEPAKNYYRDYTSVLRWSPDSSYLVDFGSYGQIAVHHSDGSTSLEGGDPETKVVLVNPKTKEQTQLLFGGPALQIMDVRWLDKQRFILLYLNTDDSAQDTLLMVTDVDRQHMVNYHYTSKH